MAVGTLRLLTFLAISVAGFNMGIGPTTNYQAWLASTLKNPDVTLGAAPLNVGGSQQQKSQAGPPPNSAMALASLLDQNPGKSDGASAGLGAGTNLQALTSAMTPPTGTAPNNSSSSNWFAVAANFVGAANAVSNLFDL